MAAESSPRTATSSGDGAEPDLSTQESTSESSNTVVDAPALTTPPTEIMVLRPFQIGFFSALGALIAVFLSEQVLALSSILVLLLFAMFLAIGLNPAVEFFMRRGLGRSWSLVVVFTLVIGVLALFTMTVAPVISEQIAAITRSAPVWFEQLQENNRVQELDERFDIITRLSDYVQDSDFGANLFGGAVGVGLKVLSAVTNTFIVFVLTIYFLASLPSIKHAAYALAPASKRPRVSSLGDQIIRSTGAYVAGAFMVAVCAGISTLIFTWIIGLEDYMFALAFVVGLLSLIPVIGALVSGVLMTLLALTVSPQVALIALTYYIAYQQFESYVIYPRIMKRSVDIPGSVTVIAALIGGSLAGIIGALLAVPVAAALLMLHREVFLKRQDAR